MPAFKQGGGRELDWDGGIPHREGATTFTFTGTTTRAAVPRALRGRTRETQGRADLPEPHGESLGRPCRGVHGLAARRGSHAIDCDFLFHPDEMAKPGFDPADAVDFWDLVNRQDWEICASVQKGMSSRVFSSGYYAPMEDLSLDIRRYLADTLGDG